MDCMGLLLHLFNVNCAFFRICRVELRWIGRFILEKPMKLHYINVTLQRNTRRRRPERISEYLSEMVV